MKLSLAGLLALFLLAHSLKEVGKLHCQEARVSNAQQAEKKDPDELDPKSFVPKGKLEDEQSFQNYIIRIYREDLADENNDEDTTVTTGGNEDETTGMGIGSFEILKDGHRVYARRGWKFRVGHVYEDSVLEEFKKEGNTGIILQDSLLRMGREITGDGNPDLVVSEWTGGVHCCFLFYIFEIGKKFRKLATIDAQDGDASIFQDLDGDSNLEIVLADFTFAYWNASFMHSPAPKVILHFRDGAYRMADNLMRKPAPSQIELKKEAKEVQDTLTKEGGINWGCYTCSDLWAVMLDLIYTGHMNLAWQFLDRAWPKEVPGKEEFIKDFKEQLAKSPYWPEVQAMNAK